MKLRCWDLCGEGASVCPKAAGGDNVRYDHTIGARKSLLCFSSLWSSSCEAVWYCRLWSSSHCRYISQAFHRNRFLLTCCSQTLIFLESDSSVFSPSSYSHFTYISHLNHSGFGWNLVGQKTWKWCQEKRNCVCMCVLHVWYRCICTCILVQARGWYQVSLNIPYFTFDTVVSWIQLGCLCLPTSGVSEVSHCDRYFIWVLWIGNQPHACVASLSNGAIFLALEEMFINMKRSITFYTGPSVEGQSWP